MEPKNGECLESVNEGLRLISRKDGLKFGTDAYLLAAYIRARRGATAVEMGSGTGILSLLCVQKEKAAHVYAIEVQPDFADLTARNVKLNGFDARVSTVCGDVRRVVLPESADFVFSNPPYWRAGAGKRNESDAKYLARHEICGGIGDFCAAAARFLRYGGSFYTVFLPERMGELFAALEKVGLRPKRMTLVAPDPDSRPVLLLTEAVRGALHGLTVTPTLFLYSGMERQESPALRAIYRDCAFPPVFLPGGKSGAKTGKSRGADAGIEAEQTKEKRERTNGTDETNP